MFRNLTQQPTSGLAQWRLSEHILIVPFANQLQLLAIRISNEQPLNLYPYT